MKIEKLTERKAVTNRQWYCFETLELTTKKHKCEQTANGSYQPSKWRRSFIYFTFLFSNFWMGMCFSLQAPFFPREAEKKGASATVYGWIIGAYSISSVFGAPLAAKLVDYIHPTMLCYVAAFMYSWCIMLFGALGWSPPGIGFIVLSTVCRITEGLSYCIFFMSANSLLVELFPANKTIVVSFMETVYGISLVLGPVFGGPLYQLGGYFLPFGVTGFIILMGSVLCFVSLRSLDIKVPQSSGDRSGLVLNYTSVISLIVVANSYISIGFNTATLEPHVRQFHLSPSMVSIFFVAYSFMYSASSVVWARLCDKMGQEHLLITSGIILSFLGVLLIGPVPYLPFKETIYSVVIAQMLLGVGNASQLFCTFSYMMKDAAARGFADDIITTTMIVGAILSSASVGEFVGPVLGGFLFDRVGYHVATLYLSGTQGAVGIIFLSGVIWKKLRGKNKMSEKKKCPLTSS